MLKLLKERRFVAGVPDRVADEAIAFFTSLGSDSFT